AYVSPSACAATVAAATSGEYCASASFSTTSTLSAPQRPSSPAPPATPGGPSSTACTSAPTASAIVRAAPTTSFDTLRSAPSRCSTTARIFAIVSPTEPWLLRAADGRAPALHPRPHRRCGPAD